MVPVVGVFGSRDKAMEAAKALRSSGLPNDKINLLAPGASAHQIESIPVTDTEQVGMGKAMGGVVGGAVGAAAGAELGAIAATILVPGFGALIAIGAVAVALLGTGGAVGGFLLGGALDETLTEGLPVDEMYLYEDALKQGKTVLFGFAHDPAQAESVRETLAAHGAESIDAARESWWLGLRKDEESAYNADGFDFTADEADYRAGFEAAQLVTNADRSYDQAKGDLKNRYPSEYDTDAFRRGYGRGQSYRRELAKAHAQSK
jgi:hypothetical protein